MKKSLIAILMTVVISLSLMAPLVSTVKADASSWYTSVNGVLSTDAYTLYPFTAQSVNVGFSKFGELIGLPAGADPATAAQADWVGLEYDGRDPFCPASVVPMTSWINGWYMDLQYIDPALSGVQRDRHLWAFAMFGDGFGWGGDWVYAATPGSNPGHGRQTNGQCVTDDLQVLYNGPREYIAMSVTHIFDKQGTATWPVVDLAITMVFDKVMKEVVLYKDVKLMLPKMHLWGKLDVQLSNREEYDLGAATGYSSYAHFYEGVDDTAYGPSYTMPTIPASPLNLLRDNVEHLAGTGGKVFTLSPPNDADLAKDFMKVWIDGVFQDPSTYTIDWTAKNITFSSAVGSVLFPADVEVHYKFVFETADDWDGTYDLAQVISSDTDPYFGYGNYVAWTAMWPPVSDYTVDGILRYLEPLVMVNEADCSTEPKQSPLIIGEWDFLMDHTDIPQFRCVEVKGITDNRMLANGDTSDDADMGVMHGNYMGDEVWYQLEQVFWPQDLRDSVVDWMYWRRWVDIVTSPTLGTSSITLPLTGKGTLMLAPWTWEDYYVEKVIVGSTLIPRYPYNSMYAMNYYKIFDNGTIFFYQFDFNTFSYIPWTITAGTRIKVLYTTYVENEPAEPGRYDWMIVGRDASTFDSAGASLVTECFDSLKGIGTGIAGADMNNPVAANAMPWVMAKWGGTGDTSADYYKSGTDYRTALKDDWCTKWPIASSSMLGVGGPLANMLAYYSNDFTTALYGLPQFSGTAYSGTITGVSCWNRAWYGTFNTYASSSSVGYAVISTYVDLNGTLVFLVWGHWGRDTYYATQWLHGDEARGIDPGIEQLQSAPDGVTSIVLKINFAYPNDATHPAFSIVECLGTISETLWRHWTSPYTYEDKGGIHDP